MTQKTFIVTRRWLMIGSLAFSMFLVFLLQMHF